MLAEFSTFPVGEGVSLSRYVAEILDIIDRSGLEYKLNPMGTVVEGEYDEVMDLISKCHKKMMENAERVVTIIKIDDRKGVSNALQSKIESVEEKLGRELKK